MSIQEIIDDIKAYHFPKKYIVCYKTEENTTSQTYEMGSMIEAKKKMQWLLKHGYCAWIEESGNE